MSEQDNARKEEDEGQDVLAHGSGGRHPEATTEPKSDDESDEVEAHGAGQGRSPA